MGFDNGWRGPNIVSDGLILYLDGASPNSYRTDFGTTWRDISGNTNNFTLVNNPTYNSAGEGSFLFNGTTQVATVASLNLQQNFTLETWVNQNALNGFSIFGQGTTTTNNGLHVWYITNNVIRFGMYSNDTDFVVTTTTGVWNHIVITYSHSSPFTKGMYINGVAVSGTPQQTQAAYTGTGTFRLGATYGSGGSYGNGYFAGMRAYNRILSAAEVLQNYNAVRDSRYPLQVTTNGLTAYLDAGNTQSYPGSGNTWTDISSYGSTFTLYNGASYNSADGGSIVFDGSNDGVSGSNAAQYSITYNITMEFWGYFTTTGNYYVMGKGPSNGVANFYPGNYEVQINNNNSLTFLAQSTQTNGDASFFTYSSTTNVYTNNTWTHFAFVITNDGTQIISSMAFYVNGVVVGGSSSGTGKAIATNSEPLRIGLRKDGAAMPGRLAIVRTYNRGLSAAEIFNNYSAQKSRFGL